jgi:NADH dehydrogenase
MHTSEEPRPTVLILGAGFGGLGAARRLRKAEADVVVVDSHDYHTFQPMLYQVATDLLEPSDVAHPVRDLFHDQPNAVVHQATASAVDLAERRVYFEEMDPIDYDYLVLALGARAAFFGVEGAAEHSFPMYTLDDAVRLKAHILRRWEAADRDPSLVEAGALDVVVVGGGPTGIETIGALAELYRSDFAKDYPKLPVAEAKLTLVEAGETVFSMFEPELQEYTKDKLEEWGVEVALGEVVTSITPTGVTLESGRTLDAHTLVWGAGLEANPIAESLGLDLQRGGRIPVGADLAVTGHPEVLAVGDIAWISGAEPTDVLPQLGSVALQSGEAAGENLARQIDGKATEPFRYHDKGTMATIGRGAAVVQLPHGRTLKGKTASLAWGAVHLALLSTGEDRTKAMLDWAWAGFNHERGGRIVVDAE